MIGNVEIKISAENPQMPLPPFSAFVGSPSSVRVRNVPREIGAWKIEKVFVSANYPDNQIVSVEAKLVGGVWVATLAASAVAGQSANGFTISANGTDENGQPVVGYTLGRGDVFILDADATIKPGETTHYIHVLASKPDSPQYGDAFCEDGTWKFWNGSGWVALGGVSAGNAYIMAPVEAGGDGLWHRMIIVDGTIAYESEGVAEPPLAADKPWTLAQIAAEASRAAGAEQEISAEIAAEASRAAGAEQEISAEIAAEASRAEGAEGELNDAITNEIARAGAAEQAKVPTDGNHTINGVKTFTQSPLVPTVASTDNSQKSASTGWVAAWWNATKAAAVSFMSTLSVAGSITASGGIVVPTGAKITVPPESDEETGWTVPNVNWVRTRIANWWASVASTKQDVIVVDNAFVDVTVDPLSFTTVQLPVGSSYKGISGIAMTNGNMYISQFYYTNGLVTIRVRSASSAVATGTVRAYVFK